MRTQPCPTLCHPMDYSPPGSSVHGLLQGRILEWVAMPSSRGSFLTQGSNPHPLYLWHWQADSLPLSHLESPAGGNDILETFSDNSIQFSHSVMSDSLRPHELQHARPPCHHQLPEFTRTHVHRVRDAIQPSHPRSSPSPPAPNPSQHQSLFQ